MIYYRISDNSYPKVKLPGATKEACLKNFLRCFGDEEITIIADKCQSSTLEMVRTNYSYTKIISTQLSNAGSFNYALKHAITLPDEEIVYFVEDDYLHREALNLMETIKEGLIKCDYVTLFDHPDKYQLEYNFGEQCVVYRTKSTHWRTTISTCMTFATTAKALKSDLGVWNKHTVSLHPHDHVIFTELHRKGRILAVSIPGLAYHTDLTYPLQKGLVDEMIEPWVLDLMEQELGGENVPKDDNFKGWRRLMLLAHHQIEKARQK